MTAQVQVQGADQLAASLRAAAVKIAQCAEPNAAAADMIGQQARRNAPRRTGALAGSVQVVSDAQGALVTVGARHGRFVEYGTRYVRPRPFLSPASGQVDWTAPYDAHVAAAVSKVRGS